MKYLVVGAGGFIGTHLSRHLVTRGDAVTMFDIRPLPTITGAASVRGDVRDTSLIEPLIRSHDATFHLAAVVGFANVMREPTRTITTGLHGTATILDVSDHYGKRVLFTSTSAIYGKTVEDQRPVQETDPCKLGGTNIRSWCYAYSKAAEECLAMAYHQERHLPVIVTRLFNTVGPGQSAKAGFVLPRFVEHAVRGEPLHVHAPGSQTRTFAHVQDVVEGLASLMECDRAVGEIVNVGGMETTTMRGLAEKVVELTESRSPVEIVPDPYGVGYENVEHRVPNLDKAFQLVGYWPQRDLDDMIHDVVAEQEAGVA